MPVTMPLKPDIIVRVPIDSPFSRKRAIQLLQEPLREVTPQPPGQADFDRYWAERRRETGLTPAQQVEQDARDLAEVAQTLANCLDPLEIERVVLCTVAVPERDCRALVPPLSPERQRHLEECEHCRELVQLAQPTPERVAVLARELSEIARERKAADAATTDQSAVPVSGGWSDLLLGGLGVVAAAGLGALAWLCQK